MSIRADASKPGGCRRRIVGGLVILLGLVACWYGVLFFAYGVTLAALIFPLGLLAVAGGVTIMTRFWTAKDPKEDAPPGDR